MSKADNLRIGVFAYNFPHKKTCDFIFRMLAEKLPVSLIIAADPVKLPISAPSIRTKLRHENHLHPKDVAAAFNIPYEVCPHNSETAIALVKEYNLDLGIIAGARILKKEIIDVFPKGVINFHPGMLPEIRGLDALLWSIYKDVPLGVTAHLINSRIDAGTLILKKKLHIFPDDSVFDITERLYEYQLEMIRESVDKTLKGETEPLVVTEEYNRKMPVETEQEVLKKFPDYIRKYAAPAKAVTA